MSPALRPGRQGRAAGGTHRRPAKRRPVTRVDHDRLFEQSQSFEHPLFSYRVVQGERAQVEIVRAKVSGRPRGRSAHLSGLQGRLDDPGDADCYLVLKVENVLKRAIEAV